MKKTICFMLAIVLAAIAFCGCGQSSSDTSYDDYSSSYGKGTSSYSSKSSSKTSSDYKSDVSDWMKDQAKGKDYSSSDGGTYYCMGKGDTCPNHTKNAYDLYCNSCDPDGDNVEG